MLNQLVINSQLGSISIREIGGGNTKRNLMIGLGAVLVAIIVIASVGLILFQNENDGDENDGDEHLAVAWNGQYHIGDFLQYQLNPSSNNQTIRYTVVGITSTEIRINSSITSGTSSPWWINYNPEYNVSRNSTFAFGMGHNVKTNNSEQDIDSNIAYTGNETISTKWGARSSEHYHGIEPLDKLSYTYDQWTYKGIVVKTVENGEVWTNGANETLIISDTNLQDMTGVSLQTPTGSLMYSKTGVGNFSISLLSISESNIYNTSVYCVITPPGETINVQWTSPDPYLSVGDSFIISELTPGTQYTLDLVYLPTSGIISSITFVA